VYDYLKQDGASNAGSPALGYVPPSLLGRRGLNMGSAAWKPVGQASSAFNPRPAASVAGSVSRPLSTLSKQPFQVRENHCCHGGVCVCGGGGRGLQLKQAMKPVSASVLSRCVRQMSDPWRNPGVALPTRALDRTLDWGSYVPTPTNPFARCVCARRRC
jgi:hypothetical protein